MDIDMTSNIYHFNIEHITSNLSIEEAAVTKFNCTHIKDTKSKYERLCVRERDKESLSLVFLFFLHPVRR